VHLFRPAVHLLLHGEIPDLARVSKVGQEAQHAPIHGGGELGGGAKAPPRRPCFAVIRCIVRIHPPGYLSQVGAVVVGIIGSGDEILRCHFADPSSSSSSYPAPYSYTL
jgi:hypothetical protein